MEVQRDTGLNTLLDWSIKLHVTFILTPTKNATIDIVKEAGLTTVPVCRISRKNKSVPRAGKRTIIWTTTQ